MKPMTFAKLVEAIDKVIELENSNRDGYVYEELASEMATAARLVYDACLDGQQFAKSEEGSL